MHLEAFYIQFMSFQNIYKLLQVTERNFIKLTLVPSPLVPNNFSCFIISNLLYFEYWLELAELITISCFELCYYVLHIRITSLFSGWKMLSLNRRQFEIQAWIFKTLLSSLQVFGTHVKSEIKRHPRISCLPDYTFSS